jgi:arsenate reductase (thioredoxin)
MNTEKIKVLFICSHNAGRSQMAEGYLNARYGDRYDAMSAGFRTSRINPTTIRVMAEIGIDIGTHYSKSLIEFKDETFDIIVILANSPYEHELPLSEATTCVHKSFKDPGSFHGNNEGVLAGFRVVRDEIAGWIDHDFVEGNIS